MIRTGTRLLLVLGAITLLGGRKGCALLEPGWVGGPPHLIMATTIEVAGSAKRGREVAFKASFGNNACHTSLRPSVNVDDEERTVDVLVGGFPNGNGGTFDAPGCGTLKLDLAFTPAGVGTYRFRDEAGEVIAEVQVAE